MKQGKKKEKKNGKEVGKRSFYVPAMKLALLQLVRRRKEKQKEKESRKEKKKNRK